MMPYHHHQPWPTAALFQFLEFVELMDFAWPLAYLGVTTVEDIQHLNDYHLQTTGMRVVHIQKLRAWIGPDGARIPVQQPPPCTSRSNRERVRRVRCDDPGDVADEAAMHNASGAGAARRAPPRPPRPRQRSSSSR